MPEVVRVLVVDDSEKFRQVILSILGRIPGIQVIAEASDGMDGVAKAQELQPELIILDIGLPKLNGIAAARKIRELSPGSRILFLSQLSSTAIVEEAMRLGAWGYVQKADAARELPAAVNRITQGQRFVGSRFDLKLHDQSVTSSAPQPEPANNCVHSVLFYSSDQQFLERMARCMAGNLNSGNSAIVVARKQHREQLPAFLEATGVDMATAIGEGRYIALDSIELLSTFVINGLFNQERFLEVCSKLFSAAANVAKGSQESCLSVCGQCAPVLWEQGNTEAAIQLERELTDIVKRLHVDVFCGYPRDTFHGEQHQPDFQSICSEHSAVHLI